MSNDNDLSFDDAWDLATEDASASAASSSEANADTSNEANNQTTDETTATGSSQDTTSTTQDENKQDGSASGPATLEEAVAQAKLWEQRFKSFEGRVQAEMERRKSEELERQKQFVDALSGSKPLKAQDMAGEDATKSSKFEELARDFPEIADAVEDYLSKKLSKTEELVKKVVEERVTPLAEDFSRQRVSSHLERILTKHPDALDLRRSGALDAWIDTLPVYAQHGARYVVAGGSVEEVTALLDQYKDYKTSHNTNTNQNTDKSTIDSGARSSSQGMMEAIKAGLAVKPGKSSDPKTDIKKSNKDDFDAGWEEAIKKLGV